MKKPDKSKHSLSGGEQTNAYAGPDWFAECSLPNQGTHQAVGGSGSYYKKY